MEELTELTRLTSSIQTDVTKFYEKHNEAAGLRARKNILTLKKIIQGLRIKLLKDKKK
jgi:hypothetical protein